MKLAELKASALDALNEAHTAAQIIEWSRGGRFNYPEGVYLLTVEHRGFTYHIGRYAGWQGRYWVVDYRIGAVYFGSLGHLKGIIRNPEKLTRVAPGEGDA